MTSTSEGIKKVFDNTRKWIVRFPNLKLINYRKIPIQFYQNDIQNNQKIINQNNQNKIIIKITKMKIKNKEIDNNNKIMID